MQALILAGGKGTRLKPYTTVIPKPLMPVGEMPILEIVLRQLKNAGFDRVIIAIGYLGEMFRAFFQDGARLGLSIDYSLEEKPLGTAGPIALNLDKLDQDVLIMNGDLLTTLNYRSLFEFHKSARAAATIGTYKRDVKIDFGVVEIAQGKLTGYIEKPVYHYDVSMGVNILNVLSARKFLVPGQHLDLPDLMTLLREDGQSVHCYQEPCYWLDIGRVDDYQTANDIFESRKSEFLP
jgi:Nucleoside-diphosphate-sugar pyrophosphorylase involved in lipopolysaccharide biosynthesis/translation initiation factor 2B, gamma/epsilon subunits (eIF-2Bgamma/eIF-2Bepsilon)